MDYFAQNLKLLCSTHRSVSDLCRRLGINRQQFNKYLSGESHPSAHNLRRIGTYFLLSSDDLFLPSEEFKAHNAKQLQPAEGTEGRTNTLLNRAFPGDLRRLRSLLGFYHTYFRSQHAAHTIVRGLLCLFEEDGMVYSSGLDRSGGNFDPKFQQRYLSKYNGLVSSLGNMIFIVEFQTLTADTIAETILFQPYRRHVTILTGLTLGVTSSQLRRPFCSHIALKYLGNGIELRQALSACGTFADDDRSIDPKIRAFFKGNIAGISSAPAE